MIRQLHFSKIELFFKYSKGLIFSLLIALLSQLNLYGQVINLTKEDGLTSLNYTCTHVDSKGIVWIGTKDGLNAYAGSKLYAITSIEDSKTGKHEPLGQIETIFEDSKGQIWVSVMDKIFLYKNNYWIVFAETEIDNYVAKDFYEDNKGRVWVMLEHFKDFSDIPEIKFSFLGGTLEMYDGLNWYKFDEDVAGTNAYSGQGIPRYYTNMLQDKDGNIWLGSLEGVYKFDGIEWEHIDKKDLVSEKVLQLMIDRQGSLWVATENGLSYQQSDNWFNISKRDGLSGSTVYELQEDPNEGIWAFTRNNLRFSGINHIVNGICRSYNKHETSLKGTIEGLIWNNDKVIAYAEDGVSILDSIGNWKQFGKDEGLQDSQIFKVTKDQYGKIWLVGNKSLYRFDNGNWEQLKEPEEWEVQNMLIDKSGSIWIGTDKNGLYKYFAGTWTRYSIENGLIDNEVNEIFEDKRGNIWILTEKGISIISAE